MKGSPVDPDRIYVSQTSGWFGQLIQRSDDGGKTWHQPGVARRSDARSWPAQGSAKQVCLRCPRLKRASRSPRTSGTTARSIRGSSSACGTSSPRSPMPTRCTPAWKTRRCSALPTAAKTGMSLPACAATAPARQWQPGAGGMGLHTIILDPSNPKRIYIAISAAGAFRTDDGGANWKPINKGLVSHFIPDPNGRSRPLRASRGHASVAARMCSSCRSTGT